MKRILAVAFLVFSTLCLVFYYHSIADIKSHDELLSKNVNKVHASQENLDKWRVYNGTDYSIKYPQNWYVFSSGTQLTFTEWPTNKTEDELVIMLVTGKDTIDAMKKFRDTAAGSYMFEGSSGQQHLLIASPFLIAQPGTEKTREEARIIMNRMYRSIKPLEDKYYKLDCMPLEIKVTLESETKSIYSNGVCMKPVMV